MTYNPHHFRRTSKDNTMVYETAHYIVVKDVIDTDPLDVVNWAVLNKEHDTVETRQAALPAAVMVCDNLQEHYDKAFGTQIELQLADVTRLNQEIT